MKITIQKKTDQLNFEDFLGGVTMTVTIAGVREGSKEQQYDIAIVGDSRVWRPSVTMLKLLTHAWGDDGDAWIGRRATLYGDPDIMFGRDKVGGIRISHMSDLPDGKPLLVSLTETRGKRKAYRVEPLAAAPARDWEPLLAMLDGIPDLDTLRAVWEQEGIGSAPEHVQAAFMARKGGLEAK